MKLTVINNENTEMCSQCGGYCCKKYAGSVWPFELGSSDKEILDNLILRLKTGMWAFDAWEVDPRSNKAKYDKVFFLRPAHINAIGKLVDYSWGGTCRFFEENIGCKLTFDERPYDCRVLKPNLVNNKPLCDGNSKQESALAWISYQDIAKLALKECGYGI